MIIHCPLLSNSLIGSLQSISCSKSMNKHRACPKFFVICSLYSCVCAIHYQTAEVCRIAVFKGQWFRSFIWCRWLSIHCSAALESWGRSGISVTEEDILLGMKLKQNETVQIWISSSYNTRPNWVISFPPIPNGSSPDNVCRHTLLEFNVLELY